MSQHGMHFYSRVGFPALFLALLLMSLFAVNSSRADVEKSALIVGESLSINSSILKEKRRINVYFPSVYYRNTAGKFPVLYMLDGGTGEDFLHIAGLVQIGALNWTMRPFILVGIENTQRKRDLTGPTTDPRDKEIAPVIGGAAQFRKFIGQELMPQIEKRYRTSSETAIVGESLAGLFVIETLLKAPNLFDSYLAIDPSLWWDKGRLLNDAKGKFGTRLNGVKKVYLATSSQEGIVEPTRKISETFSSIPTLEVHLREFPKESHLSVYHPAALQGFRLLFSRDE